MRGQPPCLLLACLGASLPSSPRAEAAFPAVELEGPWPGRPSPVNRARVFVDQETSGTGSRSGFNYPRYDARLQDGDEVQLQSAHKTWVSITGSPMYTLQGRTVALKSSSGKFCAVPPDDPHGVVSCDRETPPFAAWFHVEGFNGTLLLKDQMMDRYCCDRGDGFRCKSDSAGPNEALVVLDVGAGKVALRSGQSLKYCADSREFGGIRCDRDSVEADTLFETALDFPASPCAIHIKDRGEATTFVVRRQARNDTLALECKGLGQFLVAAPDGALRCSSTDPWPIGAARVSYWDAQSASFTSLASGLYFAAEDLEDSVGKVRAGGKEADGGAVWSVYLLAGYESVRPMIRGVNLGNWLVLESWMASDLFLGPGGEESQEEAAGGGCEPVDEYGLMEELPPAVAKRRMEKHWSTWITEEDIAWLADHGINAVRVPFGYWVVDPQPPFFPGQLQHLDALFEWCERHFVAVLLDFHGLKGSQTGNPTSGNCGACGRDACGETHLRFLEEQHANLDVIRNLTDRFSHSPAFLGFEVANEVSKSADSAKTMEFYQRAYDIIRAESPDALVIFSGTFRPSTYPFRNFEGAAEDIHVYFGMDFGQPTLDQKENLARAKKAITGAHWNVLIGEWSLGASGSRTTDWPLERRDAFFREFARMQLQAWEGHSIGWFYWSYKTAYPISTWNFRDMCELGWLPGCKPELQYSSGLWWQQPNCVYGYLEGRCPEWTPPPPRSSNWRWGVALGVLVWLALLVAAALWLVRLHRPEWWAALCARCRACWKPIADAVQAWKDRQQSPTLAPATPRKPSSAGFVAVHGEELTHLTKEEAPGGDSPPRGIPIANFERAGLGDGRR